MFHPPTALTIIICYPRLPSPSSTEAIPCLFFSLSFSRDPLQKPTTQFKAREKSGACTSWMPCACGETKS
ncbi:hypothetical protein L6452_09454 [Arctium lappa]|uniref:Uncharacterized protein n=1 Tax=Arctium lappa TaxID=4217 RepID=A0ACB9DL44_ARCLA|nr:hypothetical protein L6452_09454 [Arctium lappa]